MANAGGTTSTSDSPESKAPQRQQWIGEMRVQIPPLERSLRTPNVSPTLVATTATYQPSCRTCSGVRALAFPRKAKIVFGEHNLARTHGPAYATPEVFAERWMPEQVRHDGGDGALPSWVHRAGKQPATLDSLDSRSYLAPIPKHRVPAALVCARRYLAFRCATR